MSAYGSFELVDYAYWLEEAFFPEHDRLCTKEALLAYRALEGASIDLGACRAEIDALYARCWG